MDAHTGTGLTATGGTQPKHRTIGTGVIRRAKGTIRIQVGLDFGTSTTKVMYQRLGGERKVRPLDFQHGLDECPSFCIPSLATFDRAGNLLLGDVAARHLRTVGWNSGLSRFKMLMAGGQDARYLDRDWSERFYEHVRMAGGSETECRPEALSAAFLAYAMRRVRRTLERELDTTDLLLHFNTCVPVDQRENNKVFTTFQRAAAMAEELDREMQGGVPTREWLARAATRLPHVQYDETSDSTRLFVVPESVAGAAGYITSLRRQSGLHALIDIGAGTTDVSIFNLNLARQTGATSFWYAARSIPMGAGRVEECVAQKLRELRRGEITRTVVHQVLAGTNDLSSKCQQVVYEELTRIWNGTKKAWAEAYGHLAKESEWRGSKVRVLLAGGGALIPAAERVFSASWMRDWGPYPTSVVPNPDAYEMPQADAPFARLCVAFGLATPVPEMGNYVLPSDSPDHTPPLPERREATQDGDQLLPKYGWT